VIRRFAVKKLPACERWLNNEADRAIPANQSDRIAV
jgi:hypothetical protein